MFSLFKKKSEPTYKELENEVLWKELQRMHLYLKQTGLNYKIKLPYSTMIQAIRKRLFNRTDIVVQGDLEHDDVLKSRPDKDLLNEIEYLKRNQN